MILEIINFQNLKDSKEPDCYREKKVFLYQASANNLPKFKKKIDKVFTINSYEFWEEKKKALFKVKEHISDNGMMYIFHQILNAKGEPSINELKDMYVKDFHLSDFKNIIIESNSKPEILCVKATPK